LFFTKTWPLARRRRAQLEARALRGGSWNNTTDNLRGVARNNNDPDNRNNNIGFRVVRFQSCPIIDRAQCPILMPSLHGAPDWCSGMTCGSSPVVVSAMRRAGSNTQTGRLL